MPAAGYDKTMFRIVTDTEEGMWFNQPLKSETPRYLFDYHDRKPNAVPSDRKSPTPWSRDTVSVETDKPVVERHVYNFNGDVIWDYVSKSHLSASLPDPRFWLMPAGVREELDNAYDRSITKARDRLRDKNTMGLGQATAESKRTLEHLATTAKRGITFYRMLRSGNFLGFFRNAALRDRNVFRDTANAWLEYQYAWRPLAKDVHDAYTKLQVALEPPQPVYSSCSSRIARGYHNINGDSSHDIDCSGGIRVAYCASIENQWARDMESWGLINPLSIAWELVPFSFVADWFIPVGNVLASMTADAGLRFEWGYVSRIYRQREVHRVLSGRNWDATLLDGGEFSHKATSFTRHLLPGFAPPRLYANRNPFNTTRVTSALALITQTLMGR